MTQQRMQKKTQNVKVYRAPDFDEMLQKAIKRREEQLRKNVEQEERILKIKKEQSVKKIKKQLSRLISIPIGIGILAAAFTYHRFGWMFLEQILLSWIIGATIITTVIAVMERYGTLRI